MAWRRIARWTCAVAVFATIGLWIFSIFRLWFVSYGPLAIGGDGTWPRSLTLTHVVGVSQMWLFYAMPHDSPGDLSFWPWAYGWSGQTPTATALYIVKIPFWIPLAVSLLGFILLRPKRRPPHGCRSCDYDLTGNVSGICPECGTPIESTEKPV